MKSLYLDFQPTRKHRKIVSYRTLNIGLHFCRRSTIHGLNQIANSRGVRQRIFWICICCSASIGLFINMYYLIDKFIERPVLTNVLQDQNDFKYPEISFCFMNPIYFPPRNTSQFTFVMESYKKYKHFTRSQHDFIRDHIKFAEFLFMTKNPNYVHPIWSAVVSCKFDGMMCSYNNFLPRFLFPYGACYTFNSSSVERNDPHFKDQIASQRELEIVIYKAVDFPPNMIVDPFESVLMPSGVMVMIHDQETWPQIRESFILDGYSQIDIKIVKKHHLNIPEKCRSVKSKFNYFDVFLKQNVSVYGRYTDCVFQNVQKEVATFCNCQWPKMQVISSFHNLRFCLEGHIPFMELAQCFTKAYANLDSGVLDNCYLDDCSHTTYEAVISQSKFPAMAERKTQQKWLDILATLEQFETRFFGQSDIHLRALQKPHGKLKNMSVANDKKEWHLLNEDFVERNFMMIKIIPTSMFMDTVEETEEYPMSRLLSDIGGCIGLWIGASLITIFEFIDLLMDILETRMFPVQRCRIKKSRTEPFGVFEDPQKEEKTSDLIQRSNTDSDKVLTEVPMYDCQLTDKFVKVSNV